METENNYRDSYSTLKKHKLYRNKKGKKRSFILKNQKTRGLSPLLLVSNLMKMMSQLLPSLYLKYKVILAFSQMRALGLKCKAGLQVKNISNILPP